MVQPDSWKFGSRWSRRYAGAHTWAPMSPPVGVVLSNTRSRLGENGFRWTIIIMITVEVTRIVEVTSRRTTRSFVHG